MGSRSKLFILALGLQLTGCGSGAPIESTAPVADVRVVPSAETLRVGEGIQLYADPRDDRGRVLKGRAVSAVSLTPDVVTVSPEGIVVPVAPGAGQILASSEGKTATVSITVLAAAGAVAECDTPKPAWLWCDDFEQDRIGRYFGYKAAGESFVRAPGTGYAGSTGMRARFLRAGQVDAGNLHIAIGKTPAASMRAVDAGTAMYREVYWRFYVRYAPGWVGGGGNKLSRAQSLATRGYAQAMIAHIWSGSRPGDEVPIDRLGLEPWTGIGWRGELLTDSYNDFPNLRGLGKDYSSPMFDRVHIGKWHCIEAHAKLNDPGRGNGVFEMWIGDKPEGRLTGLNWIGSYREFGINVVYLENYWNDGAPQPQERYFDNFVVSTERIGCPR